MKEVEGSGPSQGQLRSTVSCYCISSTPPQQHHQCLFKRAGYITAGLDASAAIYQKDSVLNSEGKPVLVGGDTDGASVNVGIHNGMKTRMQEVLPWLFWAWRFSHRLELAWKSYLSQM